jgi:Rrf2 family protein
MPACRQRVLMWLNGTAQTALHAVLCIAESASAGPVSVSTIAARLSCPRNYLSKTLHQLARAGILRAVRGPAGGFLLAVRAEALSLAMVIAPLVHRTQPRCLLGRPTCQDKTPCPAHDRWSALRGAFDDFLQQTSIADLLASPDQLALVS